MNYSLAKKALVICAALSALSPAIAEDFKNSVVNMKFSQDSYGNVKVNVVTAKPYSSPVFVNQKEDNRYVILLPETKNSMTGCPVLDSVSGSVNGVAIKTQPYVSGSCKGYTKIIITAAHPIKITATSSVPVATAPVASKSTSVTKIFW